MQIIAGAFKGMKLCPVAGRSTRPSGSKLRGAVFDIAGSRTMGARALDLYAGTGAFGLEALSRGAASCVFVDRDPGAVAAIRKNIRLLRAEERSRVIRYDITRNLDCLRHANMLFDLVFVDPPYERDLIGATLEHLHESGCLADQALAVVEHGRHSHFPALLPAAFRLQQQRRYGKSLVTFLKHVVIGSSSSPEKNGAAGR